MRKLKKVDQVAEPISSLEEEISIIRAHLDPDERETILWHRRDINPRSLSLWPAFRVITFWGSDKLIDPEMLGECDLSLAFQRALSLGSLIDICKGREETELTVPDILKVLGRPKFMELISESIKQHGRISINERIWVTVVDGDLSWDWIEENMDWYFQEMYPPKAFASPQNETCDECYETGFDPETENVCVYCNGTGYVVNDEDELLSMAGSTDLQEVVAVLAETRYAVVRPEAWEEILKKDRLANAILSCETWGEYRSLGPNPFDEFVRDFAQIEDEPDDDEAFPADLPFNKGGENDFWDSFAKLEIATTYFLESLEDADDLLAAFEMTGLWSWIQFDDFGKVIKLLKEHGFKVTEANLD